MFADVPLWSVAIYVATAFCVGLALGLAWRASPYVQRIDELEHQIARLTGKE